MPDLHGKFLKPLIALYGDLGTDDMDLVIDLYTKTVAGFADDVLEAGFAIVAGSYIPSKRNPWPSPAICKKACEKTQADKNAKDAHQPEKPKHPAWDKWAIATADGLINGEMGRRAASEGWILSLHDFCRNNRRLPHQHEIYPLIDAARFTDKCAAGAVDMGLCHKALAGYANEFLAKRERLAKRVLGEAA